MFGSIISPLEQIWAGTFLADRGKKNCKNGKKLEPVKCIGTHGIFIYLPDSIPCCRTLLKLLWVQYIPLHHSLVLDLCSLFFLFVCHCYSYYIDSTCSKRSTHRELVNEGKKKLSYCFKLIQGRHVFITNKNQINNDN